MLKLISLEVQNFRSIIGPPLKLEFGDFTSIVGPNNCGKSNLLRALELFFVGTVDGAPYTAELDFPRGGTLGKGDQTKITVTLSADVKKETSIARALDELEANSNQQRLDGGLLSLRLSYSKHAVESWQFVGKRGVKNISRALIERVRDAVRQSVSFKYIPVGRDSLEKINQEIGAELIRTIFSGWSGSTQKRKDINTAIDGLLAKLYPELESTSTSVTKSVRAVFREIRYLKLRLPFSNLEEMLPSLRPVIDDTAETGIKLKGAGIQTSSLIFLLKFLADNHPQRFNARKTFVWAIEEPESFLHPSKQREMATVMARFANEVQTIITTHCPHFVMRGDQGCTTIVVDKALQPPHSTTSVGKDWELARHTLGVSLLDSMSLFPVNIVVEGPSDEILLSGVLKRVASELDVRPYDVKFFPAGNATAAAYLFESLRTFGDASTVVRLVVDGDKAGIAALEALNGRGRKDGRTWTANQDYFQLPAEIDSLCSERVKRLLSQERPAQVSLVVDTDDKIKSFRFEERHKKAVAHRVLELSDEADLAGFRKVLKKVFDSVPKVGLP